MAVALYVGHFLLDLLLARDLLTHLDDCYDELHLKGRINAPMSESEIDDLFAQWSACMKQKSNFADQIFGGTLAQKAIDAMKEDRKKKGL